MTRQGFITLLSEAAEIARDATLILVTASLVSSSGLVWMIIYVTRAA